MQKVGGLASTTDGENISRPKHENVITISRDNKPLGSISYQPKHLLHSNNHSPDSSFLASNGTPDWLNINNNNEEQISGKSLFSTEPINIFRTSKQDSKFNVQSPHTNHSGHGLNIQLPGRISFALPPVLGIAPSRIKVNVATVYGQGSQCQCPNLSANVGGKQVKIQNIECPNVDQAVRELAKYVLQIQQEILDRNKSDEEKKKEQRRGASPQTSGDSNAVTQKSSILMKLGKAVKHICRMCQRRRCLRCPVVFAGGGGVNPNCIQVEVENSTSTGNIRLLLVGRREDSEVDYNGHVEIIESTTGRMDTQAELVNKVMYLLRACVSSTKMAAEDHSRVKSKSFSSHDSSYDINKDHGNAGIKSSDTEKKYKLNNQRPKSPVREKPRNLSVYSNYSDTFVNDPSHDNFPTLQSPRRSKKFNRHSRDNSTYRPSMDSRQLANDPMEYGQPSMDSHRNTINSSTFSSNNSTRPSSVDSGKLTNDISTHSSKNSTRRSSMYSGNTTNGSSVNSSKSSTKKSSINSGNTTNDSNKSTSKNSTRQSSMNSSNNTDVSTGYSSLNSTRQSSMYPGNKTNDSSQYSSEDSTRSSSIVPGNTTNDSSTHYIESSSRPSSLDSGAATNDSSEYSSKNSTRQSSKVSGNSTNDSSEFSSKNSTRHSSINSGEATTDTSQFSSENSTRQSSMNSHTPTNVPSEYSSKSSTRQSSMDSGKAIHNLSKRSRINSSRQSSPMDSGNTKNDSIRSTSKNSTRPSPMNSGGLTNESSKYSSECSSRKSSMGSGNTSNNSSKSPSKNSTRQSSMNSCDSTFDSIEFPSKNSTRQSSINSGNRSMTSSGYSSRDSTRKSSEDPVTGANMNSRLSSRLSSLDSKSSKSPKKRVSFTEKDMRNKEFPGHNPTIGYLHKTTGFLPSLVNKNHAQSSRVSVRDAHTGYSNDQLPEQKLSDILTIHLLTKQSSEQSDQENNDRLTIHIRPKRRSNIVETQARGNDILTMNNIDCRLSDTACSTTKTPGQVCKNNEVFETRNGKSVKKTFMSTLFETSLSKIESPNQISSKQSASSNNEPTAKKENEQNKQGLNNNQDEKIEIEITGTFVEPPVQDISESIEAKPNTGGFYSRQKKMMNIDDILKDLDRSVQSTEAMSPRYVDENLSDRATSGNDTDMHSKYNLVMNVGSDCNSGNTYVRMSSWDSSMPDSGITEAMLKQEFSKKKYNRETTANNFDTITEYVDPSEKNGQTELYHEETIYEPPLQFASFTSSVSSTHSFPETSSHFTEVMMNGEIAATVQKPNNEKIFSKYAQDEVLLEGVLPTFSGELISRSSSFEANTAIEDCNLVSVHEVNRSGERIPCPEYLCSSVSLTKNYERENHFQAIQSGSTISSLDHIFDKNIASTFVKEDIGKRGHQPENENGPKSNEIPPSNISNNAREKQDKTPPKDKSVDNKSTLQITFVLDKNRNPPIYFPTHCNGESMISSQYSSCFLNADINAIPNREVIEFSIDSMSVDQASTHTHFPDRLEELLLSDYEKDQLTNNMNMEKNTSTDKMSEYTRIPNNHSLVNKTNVDMESYPVQLTTEDTVEKNINRENVSNTSNIKTNMIETVNKNELNCFLVQRVDQRDAATQCNSRPTRRNLSQQTSKLLEYTVKDTPTVNTRSIKRETKTSGNIPFLAMANKNLETQVEIKQYVYKPNTSNSIIDLDLAAIRSAMKSGSCSSTGRHRYTQEISERRRKYTTDKKGRASGKVSEDSNEKISNSKNTSKCQIMSDLVTTTREDSLNSWLAECRTRERVCGHVQCPRSNDIWHNPVQTSDLNNSNIEYCAFELAETDETCQEAKRGKITNINTCEHKESPYVHNRVNDEHEVNTLQNVRNKISHDERVEPSELRKSLRKMMPKPNKIMISTGLPGSESLRSRHPPSKRDSKYQVAAIISNKIDQQNSNQTVPESDNSVDRVKSNVSSLLKCEKQNGALEIKSSELTVKENESSERALNQCALSDKSSMLPSGSLVAKSRMSCHLHQTCGLKKERNPRNNVDQNSPVANNSQSSDRSTNTKNCWDSPAMSSSIPKQLSSHRTKLDLSKKASGELEKTLTAEYKANQHICQQSTSRSSPTEHETASTRTDRSSLSPVNDNNTISDRNKNKSKTRDPINSSSIQRGKTIIKPTNSVIKNSKERTICHSQHVSETPSSPNNHNVGGEILQMNTNNHSQPKNVHKMRKNRPEHNKLTSSRGVSNPEEKLPQLLLDSSISILKTSIDYEELSFKETLSSLCPETSNILPLLEKKPDIDSEPCTKTEYPSLKHKEHVVNKALTQSANHRVKPVQADINQSHDSGTGCPNKLELEDRKILNDETRNIEESLVKPKNSNVKDSHKLLHRKKLADESTQKLDINPRESLPPSGKTRQVMNQKQNSIKPDASITSTVPSKDKKHTVLDTNPSFFLKKKDEKRVKRIANKQADHNLISEA